MPENVEPEMTRMEWVRLTVKERMAKCLREAKELDHNWSIQTQVVLATALYNAYARNWGWGVDNAIS